MQILYIFKIRHIHIRTQAFAARAKYYVTPLTSRPSFPLITGGSDQSGRCHLLTQSAVWVLYHVKGSNRSEREDSYDIIAASIKYTGDTFVSYKEVGDTFVSHMEVSV